MIPKLTYHDAIYGDVEITEEILIDVMASEAMQRLRGILQHGISGWLGITGRITRFDHSVGTMILCRKLGASVLEQVAALLHDVSHTVWSHVIDYVMAGPEGTSYHELQKESYLSRSDIPDILAAHGYAWRDILDESAFAILEQPAPALCADRLDYFMRDSLGMHLTTPEETGTLLSNLSLYEGRIVVLDRDVAHWLGRTYMAMDRTSWANIREIGLYSLMAEAIRIGLDEGILSESDFWKTDEEVWQKLKACDHAGLNDKLSGLSKESTFDLDDEAPTFRVHVKIRTIDPDILMDGDVKPLSTIDPEFADERTQYMKQGRSAWPIKAHYHKS